MKYIGILIVMLCSQNIFAQKAIVKGNKAFQEKEYSKAEQNYRKVEAQNPTNAQARYNKANAIYKLQQTKESITSYSKAIKTATTKEDKHKMYHNMGNAYMKEKRYEEAVKAYENALRNDSKDEQTRYNYALAKKLKDEHKKNDNKHKKNDNEHKKNDNEHKKNDNEHKKNDNEHKKNDNEHKKNDNEHKKNDNEHKKNENEQEGYKNSQERYKNSQERDKNNQEKKSSEQQMENLLRALDAHEKGVRQKVQQKNKKNVSTKASSSKDW